MFDPQTASLMFMLVSRRYERAGLIVTSKPFSAWARSSATHGRHCDGRPTDPRLLDPSLKGDSYRLKNRDLGPRLGRQTAEIA